jgi:hypothetical protein
MGGVHIFFSGGSTWNTDNARSPIPRRHDCNFASDHIPILAFYTTVERQTGTCTTTTIFPWLFFVAGAQAFLPRAHWKNNVSVVRPSPVSGSYHIVHHTFSLLSFSCARSTRVRMVPSSSPLARTNCSTPHTGGFVKQTSDVHAHGCWNDRWTVAASLISRTALIEHHIVIRHDWDNPRGRGPPSIPSVGRTS